MQEITLLILIIFSFYITLLFAIHKNHNKPFGTGSREIVESSDGFINPIIFIKNFVNKNRPILLKQSAKTFPAMQKWSDDYFLNLDLTKYNKHTITTEKQKKEDRSLQSNEINFKDFVRIYNTTNIYMVDKLPMFLHKDISVPWSLQCRLFDDNIYQVLMWFSSGGTSSVVHTDDMENINCLIRGKKTFVLVDPHKHKDKITLNKHGAYSDMDVDKVDFIKYPEMSSVDFILVNMTAGDCLYLPKLWIHQVRSFESNIAINIWFRMPTNNYLSMTQSQLEDDCNIIPDNYKTFYDIKTLGLDNTAYYKNDELVRLEEFRNKSAEDLVQIILKLYSDVDQEIMTRSIDHIQSVIRDVIDELDENKNLKIDLEEIKEASKESLQRVYNYINYLKIYLVSLSTPHYENISIKDSKIEESINSHMEL